MNLSLFRFGTLCTLFTNASFAKPAFLLHNDLSNPIIGHLDPTLDAANATLKLHCGAINSPEGSIEDLQELISRACPVRLSKGIHESMVRPSRPGPFYYIRVENNRTSEEQACSRPTCIGSLKAAFERCQFNPLFFMLSPNRPKGRTTPSIITSNGVAERSCGKFSWAIVAPEQEHAFRVRLQKDRDARKQTLAAERIVKRCQSGRLSGPFPQRQNCRAQCQEECLCRKQFGPGGLEECVCPCRKT